jgi:non-specific serine/threonine protein kinase
LSSFIGRRQEILEVKQLLSAHRLVTLTGPGGSGKTRLALEVANELRGEYEDGVWLIELASVSDSALVTQTVATSLHVREQPGQPMIETLAEHLLSRNILLVIDNCEHLIHACAQFAETILERCPHLRILATSREMLGITGEVVWNVPPLTLPEQQPWKSPASAQNALKIYERSEAVQLFIDRASLLVRDFALDTENGAWVAEICRRLDGMPLAIELAAARVRDLPVQQIAQRLDDRFHLLTVGSRTALHRQQTLASTLDWSYALLSPEEQKMLQRLSVFAGGASLEAVESICEGEGIESSEVLNVLSRLVDKSLIYVNKPRSGETRYHLLETIRSYALEKLAKSHENSSIKDRFLDFYLRLVEEASDQIRGSEEIRAYQRLEEEHDNVRVALAWALESRKVDAAIRLACGLHLFWPVHGYSTEGIAWLEKALEQRRFASTMSIAAALRCLSGLLLFSRSRDLEQISRLLEESLNLYYRLEDKAGIAWVANMRAMYAFEREEYSKAKQFLHESLELRRELGNPWFIAQTMQNFPPIFLREHDYASARAYATETITWFQRAGNQRGIAHTLIDLADIARMEGDLLSASAYLKQSLVQLVQISEKAAIDDLLGVMAELESEQGHLERAAQLFGAAEAQSQAMNTILLHNLGPEVYERNLASVREGLKEAAFTQAWNEGQAMTLEQIIEFALHGPKSSAPIQAEKERWGGLTMREREVAVWIAQGKSNREIAQEMTVGVKTVETYVSRILNKLGFESRVQIATWAMEHGLRSEPPSP